VAYGEGKEDIEGRKRSGFVWLAFGLYFRVLHVLGGDMARLDGGVSQAQTTLNAVLFTQSTKEPLKIVTISRYLPLMAVGVMNTC